MCGICGVIRTSGVKPEELVAMNTAIRHRGPDDEGYMVWTDQVKFAKGQETHQDLSALPDVQSMEPFRMGFGHRRLSIIDITSHGHQPMAKAHGTLCFNGEMYNFQDIRQQLEKKGESFETNSDSEVLLRQLVMNGIEGVEDMRGMWGFAYHNAQTNELFLSRDRFGIKPIYYVSKPGFFAFASEIKALLKLDEVTGKLNDKAALEFLVYGEIEATDATLFQDIKRLPPGHHLRIHVDELEPKIWRYYDPAKTELSKDINSQQAANEAFAEVFNDSIREHCIADVEVGTCLSGGLDSSAVCLSASGRMDQLKTFTAIFPGSEVNEEKYARMVTDSLKNVDAHYIMPQPEAFMQEINAFMDAQEYPVNSLSPYAQFKVVQNASENGVKVLLDGQGADEILGGYYHFAGIYLLEQLFKLRLGGFAGGYKKLKQNFTDNMGQALMRSAFFFMPDFVRTMGRKQLRLSSSILSTEAEKKTGMLESADRSGKNYRETSLAALKYGLQTLLRYEDLNSMRFSVESRVPFLDHRLVELAINMPSRFKIHDGFTKYVLRKYMDQKLPDEVVWRKDKIGFVVPQNDWKSELLGKVKEQFNDAPMPYIFDRNKLVTLADKDLNNKAVQSEFWRIYSFINWWNNFNVH